jgi:ATP-binding protein involved in chromosome partitioning
MTDTALEPRVRTILAGIPDPHTGRTLADSGELRGVAVDGGRVAVDIVLGYPALGWHAELARICEARLRAEPGVAEVTVNVASRVGAHKVQNNLTPLPEVKNIIAVASGKGGVGK